MGILLWPFRFIWGLVGLLFGLMGRVVSIVIGLVVIGIGIALTATLITAFIGVPLCILGGSLILRAFFRW